MTTAPIDSNNVGTHFSPLAPGGGPTGLSSTKFVDTLPYESHAPHASCLITPAFRNSADLASAGVVVIDAEGFFIYANGTAETLFGFPATELCGKHIFEVTVAESSLIAEEFRQLQVNYQWSGHVLLRHPSGDVAGVGVNAFRSHLSNDEPEFIALLHATSLEGPAIATLPGPPASTQLTTRDVRLLQLIAEGFADKEIASLLSTSVWTINRDVSEMLGRLGVASRTEACVRAVRTGIIA